MKRWRWLWIALVVVLPAPARAADPTVRPDEGAPPGDPVPFAEIRARVLYGSLDGFAQTPRGGNAATTSVRRPKFDELGIDRVAGGEVELGLAWNDWRVHWGAQFLRADTSATLGVDLLSQGAFFPVGTRVHSQLQLDTYRVGLGRAFALGSDPVFGLSVVATPWLESVLFDFGHRVEAALPGQRTHREYQRFGTRLGARVAAAGEHLSFELGGFWGLPIGTLVEISTVEAIGSYALPLGARARAALQLGVSFEHTEFEDSQSTPNHIEFDYGPALVAGLLISF
jgi:hypothetical protein